MGKSFAIPTGLLSKAVMLLLVAAVVPPLQLRAEPPRDNYKFPIADRQQAEGLKPAAKIAMACTKCKTVQVRDVDLNRGFLEWFTPNVKHVCPGCGGHWSWVTSGRAPRHGSWLHTCSKCGDKSMYCCATERGKKTKGM